MRLTLAKTQRQAVALHTFLHPPPAPDEHHAERACSAPELDGREGQALGVRAEAFAVEMLADADAVVVTLAGWQPAAAADRATWLARGDPAGGPGAGVPSCGCQVLLSCGAPTNMNPRHPTHPRTPSTPEHPITRQP